MMLNASNVRKITSYFKWQLVTLDIDDNKFVDCAISANANYIVTHDKHFNILDTIDFPKVNKITISDFRKIL
jgi:predicted nucleic acid-binding protein